MVAMVLRKGNDVVPCIDLKEVFEDDAIVSCLNRYGYRKISVMQYTTFKYVSKGFSVIIVAPTGTGKTEAALFPILYMAYKKKSQPIVAIYVTPLRALNRDIAERLEKLASCFRLSVGVRHGDTPRSLRQKIRSNPPHILVTTPETFQYIIIDEMLRKNFVNLRYIVVDELREMVSSKRGIELFSAIDILEKILKRRFVKIGLTATLSNRNYVVNLFDGPSLTKVVESRFARGMFVEVKAPKPSDTVQGDNGIEPGFLERMKYIVGKIKENGHTLIFANTRDLAERIAWALTTLFKDEVKVGVHHGSLSRTHRLMIEKEFKKGVINALVATSSLELGLDIGVVKYVIQYMSPRQSTRLIQRVGRSLHRFLLKPRGSIVTIDNFFDMLESIVLARRSIDGIVEKEEIPEKPLDVLAHQIVARVLIEPGITVDKMYTEFFNNRVFKGLDYDEFSSVVNYLTYSKVLRIKSDKLYPGYRAKMYYYKTTMIPDVRNINVIDVSTGKKIGVLNEEFVALNCDPGTVIVLAGGVWKVIDYDNTEGKLYVEPLESSKEIIIPKWEGESIPVDYSVAREAGALLRLISHYVESSRSKEWSRGFDLFNIPIFKNKVSEYRRSLVIDYYILEKMLRIIKESREKLGVIPTDKDLVIEICRRDKLVVFYTFLGTKANNLLKEILSAIMRRRYLLDVIAYSTPYYIVFQLPFKPTKKDVSDIINDFLNIFNSIVVREIVMNTNTYLWRIFFVAQRFGAIDPSKVKITRNILRGYKDSIIGVEALREALLKDYDVNTINILVKKIKDKVVRIHVVETDKGSSLLQEALSRIPGISGVHGGVDLNTYKLRLLNKEVSLLCMLCGALYRKKLSSIVDEKEVVCPRCGSKAIAVVKGDGAEEARIIKKVLAKKKLSHEERGVYKELQKKAMLVMNYGVKAVVVLAGHGVGATEASRILYRHVAFNEDLYKLIYEAEKKFLRIKKYLN